MTRSIASLAVFLFCCMERTISTKIYLFSTSPFTYCGIHVPYKHCRHEKGKETHLPSRKPDPAPLFSPGCLIPCQRGRERVGGRRRRRRGASNLLSFLPLPLSPGAPPPPKAEKKKRFPFFPLSSSPEL